MTTFPVGDARPDFTRWVVEISPPLVREMARGPVSGTKFPEERFLNVAEPHSGDRTARVESTPRRRRGQDRRLARQRGEGSETVLRIGIRNRSHEGLGVRMQGFFENGFNITIFNHTTSVHYGNPFAYFSNYR